MSYANYWFAWEILAMETLVKYEIILYWSNEDEAFVDEIPELPDCMAHGST